jgi:hypothetical protein
LGDLTTNQTGRQCEQPFVLSPGEAIFDHDIPAFDVAGFLQPLTECSHHGLVPIE